MTEMPKNRIEAVPAGPSEGGGVLANLRAKVGGTAMFLATTVGPMALATAGCEEGKPPITQEQEDNSAPKQVRRPEVMDKTRIAGVVATAEKITTVVVVPKTQPVTSVDLVVDFKDNRKDSGDFQREDFSLATEVMAEGSFMTPGEMAPGVKLEITDIGNSYTVVVDTPNQIDHVSTDEDASVYVSLFLGNELADYAGPVAVQCEGGNPDDNLLVDVPEPPPEE